MITVLPGVLVRVVTVATLLQADVPAPFYAATRYL
jgi:hypothetical protein